MGRVTPTIDASWQAMTTTDKSEQATIDDAVEDGRAGPGNDEERWVGAGDDEDEFGRAGAGIDEDRQVGADDVDEEDGRARAADNEDGRGGRRRQGWAGRATTRRVMVRPGWSTGGGFGRGGGMAAWIVIAPSRMRRRYWRRQCHHE